MIDNTHQDRLSHSCCNICNSMCNMCNICNMYNVCNKCDKYTRNHTCEFVDTIGQRLPISRVESENVQMKNNEITETFESYEYIVSSFLRNYYDTIAINGWNYVQNIFHHDCAVVFKGDYIGNSYDMLVTLAKENVRNASYSNMRINWVTLPDGSFATDKKSIMITVSSNIQFITYTNIYYQQCQIIESFVISPSIDGIYRCSRHIIDF